MTPVLPLQGKSFSAKEKKRFKKNGNYFDGIHSVCVHIGSWIVVRALWSRLVGQRERDIVKNSTLKCTKYVKLKLWHFVLLFRDARSLSWNVLPNSGLGHSIIREKQITLVGKVVHVKTWSSRKGTAVLSVLSSSKEKKSCHCLVELLPLSHLRCFYIL